MIVVGKRNSRGYSLRERAPEWILSVGMVVIGVMILGTPGLFENNAYYSPLLAIASQKSWAIFEIVVGLFRLVSLGINGLWRPTAHFRAIGAVGGVTVWGSLFVISVLNTAARAPGIGTFGMLLAFDLMALWWAAGDAKIADQVAKNARG